MIVLPYGTWPSPIDAAAVASQGLRLSAVSSDGEYVYWIEGRPSEGGRNVIVRRAPDGTIQDVIPEGFNARSRVHEYGGGAYLPSNGRVFFSNFADQRIYVTAPDGDGRFLPPSALTPAAPPGHARFYADAALDPQRARLVCVREEHGPAGEPINTIVAIPLPLPPALPSSSSPPPGARGSSDIRVLASGHDFYAAPRISPDGLRLSWMAWRHPLMPWDGTELWVAELDADGAVTGAECVAGGPGESIYQPGWTPDGDVCFASDRDGWWRLYRWSLSQRVVSSVMAEPPENAEFGRPHWVFGAATWVCLDRSTLAAAYTQDGRWRLAVASLDDGSWRPIPTDIEPHDWLAASAGGVLVVGGTATMADAVVRIDAGTGASDVLRLSSSLRLDAGDVSVAEAIEFPTSGGEVAHAFFYPPRNARHEGTPGERPPLIAICHGGPTTATTPTLDARLQFWTSRGFAVVDVNYRGSSGYGRSYRQRLNGAWGVVDVADMVHACAHLAAAGRVDGERLAIRGGSAGGYTTLAALAFHPGVFRAGASYYGVSDIEVLARDTHKFEARYLDGLVGPYPEMASLYRERSPIHAVERIASPLILFQGLEDKVVPPNQSAMMADAVRAKGLPVAYLTFEGEQHGFRRAGTIARSLEAELYFYGAVFGFEPAGAIEPVPIDNLEAWKSARSRGEGMASADPR